MPNRDAQVSIAAIDVGSNSVRLLVAVPRGCVFVPIHARRITSRLYQGMQNGLLSSESIDRTARAIRVLADDARAHGAVEVLGFGTSAMRDGANSVRLIEAATECGVRLEVLSGEEEASISYLGAAPHGLAGVIDIGGGSTELLCGEDGRVQALSSVQLGAVRLMEMFEGREDASAVIDAAMRALAPAQAVVAHMRPDRWIGLGGTITTAAALHQRLAVYDSNAVNDHEIPADDVRGLLAELIPMPVAARRALPGMDAPRADIIVYGLAILTAFFNLTGAAAVYACDRDNLIGFLMKKRAKILDIGSQMR